MSRARYPLTNNHPLSAGFTSAKAADGQARKQHRKHNHAGAPQ